MNNKQVAHLWANQSKHSASGSHFYFEGDTIYSYGAHFPIARHCNGAVLFTRHGYSSTTTKHKAIVRQAASHLRVFVVDNVRSEPSMVDVNAYASRIKEATEALVRAKNPYCEPLLNLVFEANEFCKLFGFNQRFSVDESIIATAQAKRAKWQSATAERLQKKAKQLEIANAEKIQRWISGESVAIPYGVNRIYLRVRVGNSLSSTSPDSIVMETSRGAMVPISEAEKAFRFVIAHKQSGWHRNGSTFKVGDFQLDAVNEQGVIAGCHRLDWEEIERFATAQGWSK